MQSEHERFLTEDYANGPVIVSDYPKDIKAFYMRLNDDGKTVSAMDVLVPGIGEIIGGSQREERLDVIDSRIQNQKIREELSWYRDLRKYGNRYSCWFWIRFRKINQLHYWDGEYKRLHSVSQNPGERANKIKKSRTTENDWFEELRYGRKKFF